MPYAPAAQPMHDSDVVAASRVLYVPATQAVQTKEVVEAAVLP